MVSTRPVHLPPSTRAHPYAIRRRDMSAHTIAGSRAGRYGAMNRRIAGGRFLDCGGLR